MLMRKDWDNYFIDIAFQVAERSTCPRRRVGAVIVKDKRIKGTGITAVLAVWPIVLMKVPDGQQPLYQNNTCRNQCFAGMRAR